MNLSTSPLPSFENGYETELQFTLFQEMLALHATRQCLAMPTNISDADRLALPLLVSFLLLAYETTRGHMYLSLPLWQEKTLLLRRKPIELALAQLTIIETQNTSASEILTNYISHHPNETVVDADDSLFLFTLPSLGNWLTLLKQSLPHKEGNAQSKAIVLVGDRLYLGRNKNQEEAIAQKLRFLAKQKALKVVIGGPGSGKTTAIFAVLVDWTCNAIKQANSTTNQNHSHGIHSHGKEFLRAIASLPHIALTAPTGKAVVRLKNSLNNSLQQLRQLLKSPSTLEKSHPLAKVYPQIAAFSKDLQGEVIAHLQNSIEETQTLHRLLKDSLNIIPVETKLAKKTLFHFNILIIDEMSMVSYEIFYELLCQLSQNIRLQLVGDPYQLASANSGNLLKNICETPENITAENKALFVKTVTKLHGQSHRFQSDSRVGKVAHYLLQIANDKQKASRKDFLAIANAVNNLDTPPLNDRNAKKDRNRKNNRDAQNDARLENLHLLPIEKSAADEEDANKAAPLPEDFIPPSVQQVLIQHFLPHQLDMLKTASKPFVSEDENQNLAQELLERFQTKTILTAINNGSLSRLAVEKFLQAAIATKLGTSFSSHRNSRFSFIPPGSFFMVLKNDYKRGVYNGDIGVALKAGNNTLRLYFDKKITPSLEGIGLAYQGDEFYWNSQAQRVFSLTIHKSQGAEFDRVLILFPCDSHFQKMKNPNFLSRELLYTALTRTKKSAWLYVEPLVLEALLSQSERKYSVLNAMLWQESMP